MVASQEFMYGAVMLGYTELLNELSKNPSMSAKELGKVICDTYRNDSKKVDRERTDLNINSNEVLTLSVVDLSENKMNMLKSAYDNFGKESLEFIKKNPDDLIQEIKNFNKAANRSEKFPANSSAFGERWYKSPQLVDLKGFAENTGQNIPDLQAVSAKLAEAVNNAVVYKKAGNSVKRSNGLSTYYPFDLLNAKTIENYKSLAYENLASQGQKNFYFGLVKGLSDNGFLQVEFQKDKDGNLKKTNKVIILSKK